MTAWVSKRVHVHFTKTKLVNLTFKPKPNSNGQSHYLGKMDLNLYSLNTASQCFVGSKSRTRGWADSNQTQTEFY